MSTLDASAATATGAIPALEMIKNEEAVAFEAFTAIAGTGAYASGLSLSTTAERALQQQQQQLLPVSTCQPPPGYAYACDDEAVLAFDAYWDAHKRLSEVRLDRDHAQDLYFREAEVPVRDPFQLARRTVAPKAIVVGSHSNAICRPRRTECSQPTNGGHDSNGENEEVRKKGEEGEATDSSRREERARLMGRSLAATQALRAGEIIAMDTSILASINDPAIYKYYPKPIISSASGEEKKKVSGNASSTSAARLPPPPSNERWRFAQHMMRRATQDTLDGHQLLVASAIVPLLCSLVISFGDSAMKVKTDMNHSNKKSRGRRMGLDADDDNKSVDEVDTCSDSLRAQKIVSEILTDYCRHEFLDEEEEKEEEDKETMTKEADGREEESNEETQEENKEKAEKEKVTGGFHFKSKISAHAAQIGNGAQQKQTPPINDLPLSAKERELLLLARAAILCLPASLLRTETVTVKIATSNDEETTSQTTATCALVQNTSSSDGGTYRAPLKTTAAAPTRTYKRYGFFSRLGLDDPFTMAKFIAAVRSNSMGITSCPDLAPARTALFPFLRFAAHECRPNAVVSLIDSPASHQHGAAGRHNYDTAAAAAEKNGEGNKKNENKGGKKGAEDGNLFASTIFHSLEAKDVLSVPITEHAWRPAVAVLTAVRPIAAGEAVTIAYLPTAYCSTNDRRAALRDRYNFECCCRWCEAEPDLARAFRCPQCPRNEGVVCPVGDGSRISEWSCLQCGHRPQADAVDAMLDAEKRLRTVKADKHAGLAKLLGDPLLHYTHSLVFRKIDEWSERAWRAQDANLCLECIDVLKRCVSRVLDDGDPARAQIFEFCGQVQHALGNAHTARHEYFVAHQHRVRCGQRLSHWARITGFMSNAKSLVDFLDSK